jgi:CRISPR-associated exonuclease Cas4
MYSEDDLLPISALQHLLFCERQCALIHLEHVWQENRLTVEGHHLHERVHEQDAESRPGIRIVRGLRLRSLRLGLAGIADVVEFHGPLKSEISDLRSQKPFPVEYKRGKPKADDSDKVQLCAQALCLEEMLNGAIPDGALFYGTTRRRQDVAFDAALRDLTTRAADRLHRLLEASATPPAVYGPKCDNCSLKEVCLPKETGGGRSVGRYMERYLKSEI